MRVAAKCLCLSCCLLFLPSIVLADTAVYLADQGVTVDMSGDATATAAREHGGWAANGGTLNVASGLSITVSGIQGYGLYAYNNDTLQTSPNPVIVAGDGLTIVTSGAQGHGVYARSSADAGSEITLGDNTSVTINTSGYGVYASGSGAVIEAGSDLNANVADGASFNSGGVRADNGGVITINSVTSSINGGGGAAIGAENPGSRVTIGDAVIETSKNNAGLSAKYGGTITITGDLRITTTGDFGTGIESYGADNNNPTLSQVTVGDNVYVETQGFYASAVDASLGGSFTAGDNLTLITRGNSSSALLAYGYFTQVDIGSGAQMTAYGNDSYGVEAYRGTRVNIGEGALIASHADGAPAIFATGNYNTTATLVQIAAGAEIVTTGADAVAVVADRGARIELAGGTITVDRDISPIAVYASGTTSAWVSNVVGSGVFDITGALATGSYGQLNFTLAGGSLFSGYTQMDDVDTGAINLTLAGGKWLMDDDSRLTGLQNIGGLVEFGGPGGFLTLTAERLSGNGGNYIFNTYVPTESSDQIVVLASSSGSHLITIYNDGTQPTTGNEVVPLVLTPDGAAAFTLSSQIVEIGGFQYELRKDGTNWVLAAAGGVVMPPPVTPPVNASYNLFVGGGYLLNYTENQTLMQRVGELRNGLGQPVGVWAKGYGGKIKGQAERLAGDYSMPYWGIQTGLDYLVMDDVQDGRLYAGAMFGYAKGRQSYHNGKGEVDRKILGLYGTYMTPEGLYADLVLKYGFMNNDYQVIGSQNETIRGNDFNTQGFGLSLEAGRRFYLEQSRTGFYAEPQAQISYQHQSGGSFKASNGLEVKFDSYDSVLGRLGLNLGYDAAVNGQPFNVYAKVAYLHEFDGDVRAKLNGTPVNEHFRENWVSYGIGATVNLAGQHNLYLDLERADGDKFDQPWGINGGYRFSW